MTAVSFHPDALGTLCGLFRARVAATPDQVAYRQFDEARNAWVSFTWAQVAAEVVGAVKNAKAGQVQYRTDKGGIVHCTIGRASFSVEDLKENLAALLDALQRAKPASSKGVYFKRLSVSSTMGVGVRVDQASVSA